MSELTDRCLWTRTHKKSRKVVLPDGSLCLGVVEYSRRAFIIEKKQFENYRVFPYLNAGSY